MAGEEAENNSISCFAVLDVANAHLAVQLRVAIA